VGGIYGTIVAIGENGDELTLKIDDNVKVRVTRTAIMRKVSPGDAAKAGEA
jgi:preprotein translocase subunit YajC